MFATDGAYVINPARCDPHTVKDITYGSSLNKVVSLIPQGGQPQRAICMSLGFVFSSNIVYPTGFGKGQSQVKSILFGPMRAEWERSIAFFGTVFGQTEMPVSTFSVSAQRYVGINIRTFPSEAPTSCMSPYYLKPRVLLITIYSLVPEFSFIGATPTKHTAKQGQRTPAKVPSIPSHSLLDMRDKTTWNTHDDSKLV